MTPERLREIEVLHGREPAPPWATELLEEVRRLSGRSDVPQPVICPGCHREVAVAPRQHPDDALTAHQQQHNREGAP